MKLESLITLFEGENVERIKSLIARRKQISEQIAGLSGELAETENQLKSLFFARIDAAEARRERKGQGKRQRTCKLCGATDHLSHKSPDGRRTCTTYPNGKPEQLAAA